MSNTGNTRDKHTKDSVRQSTIDKKLEAIGVRYFNALSLKLDKYTDDTNDTNAHHPSPSDQQIKKRTQHISRYAAFMSFLAGALTTTPAVIFQMYYYQTEATPLSDYLWLGLIISIMLVLELGYLYWLAIKSVHEITYLLGYQKIEHDAHLPSAYAVPNLMSRAALELPDPIVQHLGIDPNIYISKKKLFLFGLLYKAKVILTSITIKITLQKITARFGVRMGFVWISIPVTAIWDAYVTCKVINDAKIRLFGYSLANYVTRDALSKERLYCLSPLAQEGTLRVFAVIIVLAENYHPNNMMIIMRLSKIIAIDPKKNYADWQALLDILEQVSAKERECLQLLLCIAAAFDAKLSKMERLHLPEAFGDEEQNKQYMAFIKQLKTMIKQGELQAVTEQCKAKMDDLFAKK